MGSNWFRLKREGWAVENPTKFSAAGGGSSQDGAVEEPAHCVC